MRKLFLLAVVCTPLLMFTESAAASIVYEVHDTRPGGSVVGSITTDGTLGPLATENIVSFNLTLSDQTDTATLATGVDSDLVFIGGGGLVATLTDLEFKFDASGAFVNFFSTDTCTPIWTLRAGGGTTCNAISGTVDAIAATNMSTPTITVIPPGTGSVSIGAVPEPGSLGLILVGLVSLIGLRKRRF